MKTLSPLQASEKNPNIAGRLHFLDAIRGIAAVSVMFFHFYAEHVSPLHAQLAGSIPAWAGVCIHSLARGVDIFFVLSGFVIAASLHGKEINPAHARNFILRRAIRLTPTYWAACTLMLAYFAFLWPTKWSDFYASYSWGWGILSNFCYLQNLPFIYPANSILDVSWTLCLEVQFYATYLGMLIAGFYVDRIAAKGAKPFGSAVVGTGIAGLACASFAYDCSTHRSDFVGRVWMFLLGILVYKALTKESYKAVSLWILMGLLVSALALGTGLVAVLTAVVIFLAGTTGLLHTLLAWRPLLFLGKISYSLYLVHMIIGLPVVGLLGRANDGSPLANWLAVGVAMAVSVIGADLLYRAVEVPTNRLCAALKQ